MGDGGQFSPEVVKKIKAEIADPLKMDKYPDMPVDDPQKFIVWHKTHFSAEARFLRESQGEDLTGQDFYYEDDYRELTPGIAERLLSKAKAKVGGGISLYQVKEYLAHTPLGKLIIDGSDDDPLVLPEEYERIQQEYREKQVAKLLALPELQKMADADPSNIRYVSAVASSYAPKTFKNGFGIDMRMGLKNNAIGLFNDRGENLWILSHPHRDRDAFIVMKFPQLPDNLRKRAFAIRKGNSFVDPGYLLCDEKEEKEEGAATIHDAVVPGRFIEGWLNLETGKYERNLGYNPQYTEADLRKMDERLKLMEEQRPFWEKSGDNKKIKIEL